MKFLGTLLNSVLMNYIRIPYAITGILNEHPPAAIRMRKTNQKDKYAEFYNEIRSDLDVAD